MVGKRMPSGLAHCVAPPRCRASLNASLLGDAFAAGHSTGGDQCYHSFASGRKLCLPAGTHLVFFGDSTMRFEYLLLCWALLHGKEYNDADQPAGQPLLHNIDTFSARDEGGRMWSYFLNYTTQKMQPHEHCDCMRHNVRPGTSATIAHRGNTENRYFRLGRVRLTYIGKMGRNPTLGFWEPGDPNRLRSIHMAGEPVRWSRNMTQVVTKVLGPLQPTHVLFWVGGVHLQMQQAHAKKHRYMSRQLLWGEMREDELRAFHDAFAAAGLRRVTTVCVPREALADGRESRMVTVQASARLTDFCSKSLDRYPALRALNVSHFHDLIHVDAAALGILTRGLLELLFPEANGGSAPAPGPKSGVEDSVRIQKKI